MKIYVKVKCVLIFIVIQFGHCADKYNNLKSRPNEEDEDEDDNFDVIVKELEDLIEDDEDSNTLVNGIKKMLKPDQLGETEQPEPESPSVSHSDYPTGSTFGQVGYSPSMVPYIQPQPVLFSPYETYQQNYTTSTSYETTGTESTTDSEYAIGVNERVYGYGPDYPGYIYYGFGPPQSTYRESLRYTTYPMDQPIPQPVLPIQHIQPSPIHYQHQDDITPGYILSSPTFSYEHPTHLVQGQSGYYYDLSRPTIPTEQQSITIQDDIEPVQQTESERPDPERADLRKETETGKEKEHKTIEYMREPIVPELPFTAIYKLDHDNNLILMTSSDIVVTVDTNLFTRVKLLEKCVLVLDKGDYVWKHISGLDFPIGLVYKKQTKMYNIILVDRILTFRQNDRKWRMKKYMIPNNLRFYSEDKDGNEVKLTTEHYDVHLLECNVFRYIIFESSFCTKIMFDNDVIWERNIFKPYVKTLTLSVPMNIIRFYFPKRIYESKYVNNKWTYDLVKKDRK
ncbi:Theileria-specific sub-telomeric protein, SVSP family, putative [Theileria annulata]|uniref:Theileria-specific sub-telomeric protein, SVSP family, putative n=1 Tax=Theileria annulata TaxID=5874 RepID=Q4UAR9_THEAN|nr:Theileria-specific sub-telomeric protein, SVSP family, putative [Theileria annulata]CAI76082.1 Theileria-specific sub-telomeric protein, SVSP family, putative [Theileria annulata]|eukprot:XP_952708.1 Theileria-specific sub-telomeric protein, SVSP family, putative [Theileria annulata]